MKFRPLGAVGALGVRFSQSKLAEIDAATSG